MFQVKVINSFWRNFPTEILFVRKKLSKNLEKVNFLGVLYYLTASFHLNSSSLLHSKYGFHLCKKKRKHPQKLFCCCKIWKNDPRNIANILNIKFFLSNFISFRCSFLQRHNLVTSTVFSTLAIFMTSNKTNCLFKTVFIIISNILK